MSSPTFMEIKPEEKVCLPFFGEVKTYQKVSLLLI